MRSARHQGSGRWEQKCKGLRLSRWRKQTAEGGGGRNILRPFLKRWERRGGGGELRRILSDPHAEEHSIAAAGCNRIAAQASRRILYVMLHPVNAKRIAKTNR